MLRVLEGCGVWGGGGGGGGVHVHDLLKEGFEGGGGGSGPSVGRFTGLCLGFGG